MKSLILATAFACCIFTSVAQSPDSLSNKRIAFFAGVTYHSYLNYYGRTDSIRSQGIYPYAGVNFRNRLYINSSFLFVLSPVRSMYTAAIGEAGYNFKSKKENWVGNLFISKYFYNSRTLLLQSALKGAAGVNVSNLNKTLNVNFGGDVKFGEKADFNVFAGLDHLLKFTHTMKGTFFANPSVYAYAGTQKFYKDIS